MQFRQLFGFVPWDLYSLGGMAVTEAVGLAPIAYVFCVNALRKSDASLESAARVCGAGPIRILFSVVVPDAAPADRVQLDPHIRMSLETLSVPLLYGTPVRIQVFSTFLYTTGCSRSGRTTESSARHRRSSSSSRSRPSPSRPRC